MEMDKNGIPILPDYPYLTELMTDEEVEYFNTSIFQYVVENYCTSDYYCAQINDKLWKRIWAYRKALDEYYENGGNCDA